MRVANRPKHFVQLGRSFRTQHQGRPSKSPLVEVRINSFSRATVSKAVDESTKSRGKVDEEVTRIVIANAISIVIDTQGRKQVDGESKKVDGEVGKIVIARLSPPL